MRLELVVVTDERGIEIYFVDFVQFGTIADSRFFETERDALAFMAMGGER